MTRIEEASLKLEFRPDIDLVSVVRRFVADFYTRILADPDAASRIALAVHELLENTVKHSIDGETSVTIDVEEDGTSSAIIIAASNRAAPEHMRQVSLLLDEMDRSQDPFSHYQSLLRKNARRTDGSGLGLARIRAEGEMSMRYSIHDDRITIVAETQALARVAAQ
jgi:anti-sigma regulatory factor (Ser/Thr protein kinase)